MKTTINEIRQIIREVLEEVYMKPHHTQGIGPDVDFDQKERKITSTEALRRFPQAIRKLIQNFEVCTSPDDMDEIFGGKQPYPKDIVDLYELRLVGGKLTADWQGQDIVETWDEKSGDWH